MNNIVTLRILRKTLLRISSKTILWIPRSRLSLTANVEICSTPDCVLLQIVFYSRLLFCSTFLCSTLNCVLLKIIFIKQLFNASEYFVYSHQIEPIIRLIREMAIK
jgi:hypothetical protein